MDCVLDVRKLSKNYGKTQAISGIQFQLNKGEVVGFLGPNGAGKSTTMRIICGVIPASDGEVLVAGASLKEEPLLAKSHIGYLPEIPPLYLDMRVEDYLEYVAALKKVEKSKILKYVTDSIEQTNLGEVRKKYIAHLSKGFRQRVGIAQALVSKPEILVLDEPSVGLDPKQVAEIRSLIKSLAKDQSVILSTHILPEVQSICERVIILSKGKIVAEDSMENLNSKIGSGKELLLKTQSHIDIEKLQQIDGIESISKIEDILYKIVISKDIEEDIIRFVLDNKYGFVELKHSEIDLEGIFLQLTGE